MYHNKRPTVRMLETLEECKPILRQLYDAKQVTLSYQSFDLAKPQQLQLPQKNQPLVLTERERQANIERLSELLLQLSSSTKTA